MLDQELKGHIAQGSESAASAPLVIRLGYVQVEYGYGGCAMVKTQLSPSGPARVRPEVRVSAGRIGAALLGAGLFNFVWLVVFLLAAGKPPRGPIAILLWCIAPIITALGFSYGTIVFNHLRKSGQRRLTEILPWPLIGCILGAAIVFPFGPMFIGAGMFALGGAAIVLREALALHRLARGAS